MFAFTIDASDEKRLDAICWVHKRLNNQFLWKIYPMYRTSSIGCLAEVMIPWQIP